MSAISASPPSTLEFLRAVLARLAERQRAPSPENFARAWRELRHEHGLPVGTEYVDATAVLEHAISAFDDLFVGDAWLRGKLAELREVVIADGVAEETRHRQVKMLIEEIDGRKGELLYHLAESSGDLRRSVGAVIDEVGRIGDTVEDFQGSIGRYRTLVQGARDAREVRRIMSLVVDDARRLDDALQAHRARVRESAQILEAAGSIVLGNLSPAHLAAADRLHPSGPTHPVSDSILGPDDMLSRMAEPAFADGAVLLVELADADAAEDQILAFSSCCVDCLAFPVLLGYWGGSQFVYLLPRGGVDQAIDLARALRLAVLRSSATDSIVFNYGAAAYRDLDPTGTAFFGAFEAALADLRPMQAVRADG